MKWFAGIAAIFLLLGFVWINAARVPDRVAPYQLSLTPTAQAARHVTTTPPPAPPQAVATSHPGATAIVAALNDVSDLQSQAGDKQKATPTAIPPTPASGPSATPSELPSSTPTGPLAPTATPKLAPPTKVIAKASPTRDPLLMPNGVRYGDRRPSIPHRIVRIASPNIKLDTSVYEVYAAKNGEWEVADYAAGHNYNSADPGEGGNIVLAGHNNWRGEVFRYLEFLKPGDEIDVWTLDGNEHKYKVTTIEKLKEAGVSYAQRLENAKVMNPTDHEQLTLITCWPYTTFTHRLIVIALPE